MHGLVVRRAGGTQGGQQPVLLGIHDLARGKGEIHQVLAQRAGERLFQDGQQLFGFRFLHEREGRGKLRHHLALFVDVTPADVLHHILPRAELAADFRRFFLVHFACSFPVSVCSGVSAVSTCGMLLPSSAIVRETSGFSQPKKVNGPYCQAETPSAVSVKPAPVL